MVIFLLVLGFCLMMWGRLSSLRVVVRLMVVGFMFLKRDVVCGLIVMGVFVFLDFLVVELVEIILFVIGLMILVLVFINVIVGVFGLSLVMYGL